MSNPWVFISLEDYEGHMNSPTVQQLTPLANLFKRALDYCHPESVAVLGIAGGNGLEQIDRTATKRIVGVDINQTYLDKVQQRFGPTGLELYCLDLAEQNLNAAPVTLVHAALIFEHAGLGIALENALSLVARGGHLSVVLQVPSKEEPGVSTTNYTSMQTLKQHFALIDVLEFQRILERKGSIQSSKPTHPCPAARSCGSAYSQDRNHHSIRFASVGRASAREPASGRPALKILCHLQDGGPRPLATNPHALR